MKSLKSRLKSVMSVQSATYKTEAMNKFITDEVNKIPNTKIVKKDGNLYVVRGSANVYPCVVAHTDTVHDIHKEFHVLECNGAFIAINEEYERVGVGGDDKVGIFVALEALRSFKNIKVAFFRDEEVGCHGSKVADMKFFNDVAFVLQCDRRGYSDFVNNIFSTDLYSTEFSKALQPLLFKYGRVESDGGLTDVYQLAENGLEICVANMSCGYYDPHSDNEYIMIKEVFATLEFVKEICNDLGDTKWVIKTEDRDTYSYYKDVRYNRYDVGQTFDDDTYGYRKYGGGKVKGVKGYDYHTDLEWEQDADTDDDVNPGYLVSNATCCKCDGVEKVHYDEYMDLYYCFGCDDYITDDDVKFEETDQSDSFLQFIEDRQKLNQTKINKHGDDLPWD